MLWLSKTVEFSEEDSRLFVEAAQKQLTEALDESLFVSTSNTSALVTESYVGQQVDAVSESATVTLDTTAIATQLQIPRYAVETVIDSSVRNTSAFSDNIHVLPAKKVSQIGESLTSKISKISDICLTKHITIKAVEYVVKCFSDQLTLIDDVVVPNKILKEHVTSFQRALEQTKTPVRYDTIEPDQKLLNLIKANLKIPSHESKFVPQEFVDLHMDYASKISDHAGYVTQSVLEDTMDPAKFAKLSECVLIGSWIVTNRFVNDKITEINNALQKRLWFDLRVLPLDPELGRHISSQDARSNKLRGDGKKYPSNYLVRSQLERDLLDFTSSKILASIPEKIKNVQFDSLSGTSTIGEFVDQISLPDLSEVEKLIPKSKAPSDLKIAQAIWPQIRQNFRIQLQQGSEPLFETAQLKLEAQIGVYLNAVENIQQNSNDPELFDSVFNELQQYISDRKYSVPSTIDIAMNQFSPQSNKYITETRERLIANSRSKLEKIAVSKKKLEAALISHSATTIYHAEHYCSNGLLKIRGKAVPKLLKQFSFPSSFTESRKNLKEPSAKLISKVVEDT